MSLMGEQTPTEPIASQRVAGTLRDLVVVAFYHKRIIITVILLAVIAAAGVWSISPVRFLAKAQLLVLTGRDGSQAQALGGLTSLLSIDAGSATQSEAEFLRDRAVVRAMVEQIGPEVIDPEIARRRLFGLLPPRPPEERLEAAIDFAEKWLTVTVPPGSNIIVVTFTHENRELALEATDTLVNGYLKRRSELYRSLHSPFLRERASAYADQLKEIEDKLEAARKKYNVLDIKQEVLLALNQVDLLEQRQQQQTQRQKEIAAEISTTQEIIGQLQPTIFDFTETGSHVSTDEAADLLAKLHLEQDNLSHNYTADFPRLAEVNRQIKLLDDLRKENQSQLPTTREVRNPTLDIMNNHLSQIRTEAAAVASSLTELDRQETEARKRVDELRDAERAIGELQRSQTIVEQLFKETNQKAEAARLEEASTASKTDNIQVIDKADASLRGISSRTNLALAVLVGGFMAAGALTLMAAWNRRILLLPEEVGRDLKLPLLATFNEGDRFDSSGAQAQIIYLAGQLAFTRKQAARSEKVQVISSGRAEQRSVFAAALAIELAQGQSQRTLLLDLVGDGNDHAERFNSTDAKPHRNSSINIASTPVPGLHVSVGASAGEVNWLRANGDAFSTLFNALGDDYDMILIDAPAARDSLVGLRLASVVDGSILVLRAEHTRIPVVEHLCGQILGAGGDLFGAVVTGRQFHVPKAIYRWL